MKHRRANRIAAAAQVGLPTTYGQTRLTLLDVDSFHVHASWEITPRARAAAEKNFVATSTAFLWILRFHDEREGTTFDIPVNPDAGSWYVELWTADKTYFAELGACSIPGEFVPVCRSNIISTPPAAPALPQEPQWLEVTEALENARRVAAPAPVEEEQKSEVRSQRSEGESQRSEVSGQRSESGEQEAFPLAQPPHSDIVTPVEAVEALELPATMAAVLEEKPAAATATVQSISSDSVSSFSLGGRAEKAAIELEINAEVIVYGRAQPGQTLRVNGRPVPVNDDGTFHVRWALPVAKP